METTEVIFRVEKDGSILAVFPYISYSGYNYVTCYQHIGQHGEMDWDYMLKTKPAAPEQYADLKAELESIGYNLKVIKRAQRSKMCKL